MNPEKKEKEKRKAKETLPFEFKVSLVLLALFLGKMCAFTYLTLLCWIINSVISDLSRGDFTSESLLNLTFRCRHLLQIEAPALGLGFEIQAMSFREDLRKVRKKASFCVTHWTQQNGSSNNSSQWVLQATSGWIYFEKVYSERKSTNISIYYDNISQSWCVSFHAISVSLSDCWEMTVIALLDRW